jgi:hypothetical protein
VTLERPEGEPSAASPRALRYVLAGIGLGLFAAIVNLVASVYLITYEDTYEASKGALWSLTSMTPKQQAVYIIAAYGVPAMLVLAVGLIVYAIARSYRARKRGDA